MLALEEDRKHNCCTVKNLKRVVANEELRHSYLINLKSNIEELENELIILKELTLEFNCNLIGNDKLIENIAVNTNIVNIDTNKSLIALKYAFKKRLKWLPIGFGLGGAGMGALIGTPIGGPIGSVIGCVLGGATSASAGIAIKKF